jgi:hypothetical protein
MAENSVKKVSDQKPTKKFSIPPEIKDFDGIFDKLSIILDKICAIRSKSKLIKTYFDETKPEINAKTKKVFEELGLKEQQVEKILNSKLNGGKKRRKKTIKKRRKSYS